MEGPKSRKSEAAATRKRRSSILKSQRAPRTPFSELEFSVATPTDAKSRRVSFSRRNGVAEFEITEATTAWKNVYEEHNKSLESSVNESGERGERRPLVPHLSRRTGLMFEDVEADVVAACSRELGTSFNAAPDLTHDEKSLSAPRGHFSLNECTHQRTEQLFDDDPNPIMKEMTDQIDLNFSSIMPLSDQDLDLIQDRKSNRMSYIDADLNETHISLKGNDSEISDMSITDTIHSPKVAASKVKSDGKINSWVADKENVVVNPYVAPLPAENFAVDNDCDDVLVFDGKKCKFQSDLNSDLPDAVKAPANKSLNKRTTIVYNDDDGDISMTQSVSARIILPLQELNPINQMNATIFESNISMTQAIPSNVIISNKQDIKQQTIYFNDLADITVTETVPSRVLEDKKEQRRKTIVYDADEGQVSMTEAVPVNILVSEVPERRKTILYQDNEGDISMTQAVPVIIIQTNKVSDKSKTIIYNADASELQMTEAVPVNVLLANKPEKRKTILFANDDGNMSLTQAIPAHIMRPNDSNLDNANTINCQNVDILFNSTKFDASLKEILDKVKETQESITADVTPLCSEAIAIEADATEANNKRRTIAFNDDQCNVSITQSLPINIIDPVPVLTKSADFTGITDDIKRSVPVSIDSYIENDTSLAKNPPPDRRVTIPDVIDDISINKTAVIEKVLSPQLNHSATKKSIIIANEYESGDKSITQAVSNISNKINTLSNDEEFNIPMAKPIPAQMIFIKGDLVNSTKDEKLDTNKSEIHAATLDMFNPDPQNIIVYEATVKLDKTDEVPIANTAELASNESLKPSPIDPLEVVPEPMEEHNSSESSESMLEIRDVSLTKVVEEDKPTVVQASVLILNDLLDMSNASMDGGHADKIDASMKMAPELSSGNVSVKESVKNKKESQESVFIINDSNSEPVNVQFSPTKPVMDEPLPIEYEHDKSTVVEELKKGLGRLKNKIIFKHAPKQIKLSENKKMESRFAPVAISPTSIKADKTTNDTKAFLDMGQHKPMFTSPPAMKAKNIISDPKALLDMPEHEPLDTSPPDMEANKTMNNNASKAFLDMPEHEPLVTSPFALKAMNDNNKTMNDSKEVLDMRELEPSATSPPYIEAHKTMNETKALLDLLSHLTESRISKDFTHGDNEEAPVVTSPPALNNLSIEDKTEGSRVRRSMVPDRKSMIRSREDLLKDISMAQAMLVENEEEEPEDIADDSIEPEASPVRDERAGNEVVKTLRFDDEESVRAVESPLKKTFVEKTHSHDGKAKVIPEYLAFTNDLKELMNDLVKPMVDMHEKRNPPSPRKTASTCSTQIQANLLNSSQIDLLPEQYSSESIEPPLNLTSAVANSPDSSVKSISRGSPVCLSDCTNGVVVFDHNNPLNNVLLPMMDACDVHRYDPRLSVTSLVSQSIRQEEDGKSFPTSIMNVNHSVHIMTEPPSSDQSVDVVSFNQKDSEVNTVITMKRNEELLGASSSLTLVDDTVPTTYDSSSPSPQEEYSPVKVLFQFAEDSSQMDDLISADDESVTQAKKRVYSPMNRDKKHCTFAVDVTPKPASKVQKVSDSPSNGKKSELQNRKNKITTRKQSDSGAVVSKFSSRVPISPPTSWKTKDGIFKRTETAMTIHKLITKYNSDGNADQETLAHQILSALSSQNGMSENSIGSSLDIKSKSEAPDVTSGCDTKSESEASDGSYMEVRSGCDIESKSEGSDASCLELRSGCAARPCWQPELLHEMSSKNLASERDAGVNVVAKIDMLPFMGTSSCEWESRGADAWSLRLLRGRARLRLRLAHRHGNATRTAVRADTSLRDACVQPVLFDNDDPITVLCVRFAAETMGHFVRDCRRAGDVPALLRRCAGVARVALRWARAMHAARAHLAFTLAPDGRVSLKVANIPLRSVWEVTMRIELVSSGEEPPTPLAREASAARAVAEHGVPPAELARLLAPLARDWGHAPRALWKIFKYLKYKTLDNEVIII